MADFRKSGGYGDRNHGNGGGRSFGGGRPSFGGGKPGFKKFGGAGGSGRTEMHHAVCSQCGKDCEVPFRPNGEKPVFCSACFDQTSGRDAQPRTNSYNDRNDRRDFSSSSRSSAPAYAKPAQPAFDPRIDELKAQIEKLHVKIDRLINSKSVHAIMNEPAVIEMESETSEVVVEEKPKAKATKKVAAEKPAKKVAEKKTAAKKTTKKTK